MPSGHTDAGPFLGEMQTHGGTRDLISLQVSSCSIPTSILEGQEAMAIAPQSRERGTGGDERAPELLQIASRERKEQRRVRLPQVHAHWSAVIPLGQHQSLGASMSSLGEAAPQSISLEYSLLPWAHLQCQREGLPDSQLSDSPPLWALRSSDGATFPSLSCVPLILQRPECSETHGISHLKELVGGCKMPS